MEVYGVVGWPVDHSLSPTMFNAAFAATAHDGVYGTLPVHPDRLEAALEGAHALGISGLNVTTPHKETALGHVQATSTAQSVGAINTIDLSTDPPTGTNTDVEGFGAVLDAETDEPGEALVIGAGGAARAYTAALVDRGWSVVIANRTVERARVLAAERGDARAVALDEAPAIVETVDLILNATTVGMGAPGTTPIHTDSFDTGHTVIDAVYRPRETALIRDARKAGAAVVTGDRLLLEQAVASYRMWFGEVDVPRRSMARALTAALDADAGV